MQKVGLIGTRGMVGSALLQRMQAEGDLELFKPTYFSTSDTTYENAFDISLLKTMDVILTCQGSDYTEKVYPQLRDAGWDGYWIDAASYLRMHDDSIIALDPLNQNAIQHGMESGIKNYIGGNCTVSLLLLALHGLLKADLLEWVSVMTYQAASGAGAQAMQDLVTQMAQIGSLANPDEDTLTLDSKVTALLNSNQNILAGNILPWIDSDLATGQSREEYKLNVEANKILNAGVTFDGICVRVGSMRCHSQALTMKLKRAVPIPELEQMLADANEWVKVVPNTKNASLLELTPAAVAGKLTIPIGRIRQMNLGPEYVSAFTVGDQLLWGAAEPLRRVLKLVLSSLRK